jgi:hypothetical protein
MQQFLPEMLMVIFVFLSWSPAGAIRAGRNPAVYKFLGEIIHVDGQSCVSLIGHRERSHTNTDLLIKHTVSRTNPCLIHRVNCTLLLQRSLDLENTIAVSLTCGPRTHLSASHVVVFSNLYIFAMVSRKFSLVHTLNLHTHWIYEQLAIHLHVMEFS